MNKNKKSKKSPNNWQTAAAVAFVAAFLYSSWPLGYYLNPSVSAHGLASELAARGQPYNWLFMALDVISGLLVVVVAWLIWRSHKKLPVWWLKPVLAGFALFGVFTAFDALLPMHCTPSLRQCPSLGHDHLLILHGVASISAAVFLFLTAFAMWQISQLTKGRNLMGLVMIAWILFGFMSLVFFFVPGPGYLAQHYFITLCSVWMVLLPYVISRCLATAPIELRSSH